jgi:hypothetical protein
MLTAVTVALVCGGIPATAQEHFDDPAITRHWDEAQQNQGDEEDTGRVGHGMMRHCIPFPPRFLWPTLFLSDNVESVD